MQRRLRNFSASGLAIKLTEPEWPDSLVESIGRVFGGDPQFTARQGILASAAVLLVVP
jgi:hypothetical protein